MNVFVDMKPWENLRGERVIEPISNSPSAYDLHSDAYIKAIMLKDEEGSRKVVFHFVGQSYLPATMELSGVEEEFELVFHDVTNLKVSPEGFLPFNSRRERMDDFMYSFDEDAQKAHIGWYGEISSLQEDPEIDFWASKIEFKMG